MFGLLAIGRCSTVIAAAAARFTTILVALALGVVFVTGAAARATDAPPNDDRANAQVIAAFPAAIAGTSVGATVERLDPQKSQCGTVESTVWYRINQAPDGTVAVSVSGAGLAPVVRVYAIVKSGINELDCATTKASGTAKVTWETTRGSSYLVLVGKKTGSADAAFSLNAQLFLPPANDSARQAKKLAVGAQIKATTVGATSDASDPHSCNLAGGTDLVLRQPQPTRCSGGGATARRGRFRRRTRRLAEDPFPD